MNRLINRRSALLVLGIAGVSMVSSLVAAQTSTIRGIVDYQGGEKIPKGSIEISFEDSGVRADVVPQAARLESDGRSKSMIFSLPVPASLASSPTHEVVAHLLRGDGWLLARGSAQIDSGGKVSITLYAVLY